MIPVTQTPVSQVTNAIALSEVIHVMDTEEAPPPPSTPTWSPTLVTARIPLVIPRVVTVTCHVTICLELTLLKLHGSGIWSVPGRALVSQVSNLGKLIFIEQLKDIGKG